MNQDRAMPTWIRNAMDGGLHVPRRLAAAAAVALLLAGCATPRSPAPVEDRSVAARPPVTAPAPVPEPAKAPGSENAGKPGFYTVKPGDTMIRVGLETGQNWKDIVKWNNLDNPNVIEVGQVLRVAPPSAEPGVATRPVAAPRVEARPLDSRAASAPAGAPAPATSAPVPTPPRDADDDLNWQWPASGALLAPFEEGKAKGLTIGGKAGDPVLAAAEGRVVYAGSGLRGYGNLVILKHNNTYLTAYAHNQSLAVKEDQMVRRGQKIAEMGSSDSDRVQLHFEIRKQGKPIDPAKLLPPR
jgi:lipoprotein NlpD